MILGSNNLTGSESVQSRDKIVKSGLGEIKILCSIFSTIWMEILSIIMIVILQKLLKYYMLQFPHLIFKNKIKLCSSCHGAVLWIDLIRRSSKGPCLMSV